MEFKLLLERKFGKKNSNWKGKLAGKRAKHHREGSAEHKSCKGKEYLGKDFVKEDCKKTGKLAFMEWAEIHGTKKLVPMCKSCHSKYDKKYKNFT